MKQCRNCLFHNPDGMNYCGQCGHPLELDGGARLEKDGGSLPAYALRQPRDYTPPFLLDTVMKSRHAMAGENKRVAVLFADVAGITGIAEQLDPESLHQLMDGCFEILGKVIHGTGGTINQYTGDGIMAIFGAPIALEDYTARSCYAAIEIQRRLRDYRKMVSRKFGVIFEMRIGINSGQVLVGAIGDNLRLDYSAVGDTTNLAARLEASAAPGGIHVSKNVADTVWHLFHFENLGKRHLKGKSRPQQIYRLLAEKKTAAVVGHPAGFSSVLVGRETELARLKSAWDQACANAQIAVSVIGPAGSGKTRLLTHWINGDIRQEAFVLTGSCKAYGASEPFQLLMEMLAKTFSAESSTTGIPSTAFRNLIEQTEGLLDRFNRACKQAIHEDTLLEGRKRAIFSQLGELFIAAARIRPCLIAIDNCQWLDSYTIEFLSALAAGKKTLPLLILCSGRWPSNYRVLHPSQLVIELEPIDSQSAISLFAAALGTKHVDILLKRIVLDRAGGNPLFLIELAASLLRNDQLVIDRHRAFLKSPMDQLKLPSGVYDVLAARLDALPENHKHLLQIAAVAGNEFSQVLLEKVVGESTDLSKGIDALEKAGLIHRPSPTDSGHYRFRQQMMRDVAYDMMLRQTRKQFHQKIGNALEHISGDRLNNVIGQLAYHFYMADHRAKALGYNLEAGHQARRIFACHNALVYFDRAAEILNSHYPENRASLLLSVLNWKGLMHYCVGQLDAALEMFKTLLALAETGQHGRMTAEGLFRIGWIYFFLHKPRLAQKTLVEARQHALQGAHPGIYLKATSFLGSLHLVLGKFKSAQQFLIEALDLSQGMVGNEARAWTLGSLIKHYNWTGEFEEALNLCEELETLNQKMQSRYFDNFLLFQKGLIFTATGQWQEAKDILNKGLARWEAGDEPFWRPRLLNTLGWLMALKNDPQRALSLNHQALAEAHDSGDLETIYSSRINIAENYLQINHLDKAKKEIEAVWREIRYKREVYAIWRVKTRARLALARLYMATGDYPAASRHARCAQTTAVETGATKHQALALHLRSKIISRTNPKKSSLLMKQSLHLATQIKTPWLFE